MMHSPLLALGIAAGGCLAPAPRAPGRTSGELVERHVMAMGTWLELQVRAASRAEALEASERALRAVEAVEARLSTWREESELSRLNRAPVGERVTLSSALAEDLARVERLWRASGGVFDPGLGALVEAWGLREGGRSPAPAELERARSSRGFASIELADGTATRRDPEARVEEGGFGKGIGLDAALAALAAAGIEEAVLDLGGQIAFRGEGTLEIALADPRERDREVLALELFPGSLATSGNSERGIVVDGVERSHILDPRTGEPAPDFGSLSVWASDATTADCLSKLYVLGPEGALRWAAENGAYPIEVIALVVTERGLVARASAGWRGRIRLLTGDVELEFFETNAHPSSTESSRTEAIRETKR